PRSVFAVAPWERLGGSRAGYVRGGAAPGGPSRARPDGPGLGGGGRSGRPRAVCLPPHTKRWRTPSSPRRRRSAYRPPRCFNVSAHVSYPYAASAALKASFLSSVSHRSLVRIGGWI